MAAEVILGVIVAGASIGSQVYSANKSDEANKASIAANDKSAKKQEDLLQQAKDQQNAEAGLAASQSAAVDAKKRQQEQAAGALGRSGTNITKGSAGTTTLGGTPNRTSLLGL